MTPLDRAIEGPDGEPLWDDGECHSPEQLLDALEAAEDDEADRVR